MYVLLVSLVAGVLVGRRFKRGPGRVLTAMTYLLVLALGTRFAVGTVHEVVVSVALGVACYALSVAAAFLLERWVGS